MAVEETRLADEPVRTKLMSAAIGLFARKGYAATTVREIVTAAGVTKPVLYYYFGSKEGIFLEMIREALREFEATTAGALAEGGSAAERIFRLLDRVFGLVLEHLDVMRVLDGVYYGPPQGAPFFDFEVVHERFVGLLKGLVEEGIAAGELRAGDPEDIVWAIIGPFEVARGMSLCHPEVSFGRDRLARLLRVIFQGVVCEGVRESER